jgi:hypothetical protein
MGRYGNLNYPKLTRQAFFVGVALFAIGALGEFAGHAVFGTLPAWENTLLFDIEVLGVLIGLFAPIIFGIVLPLTE